MTLGNVAHEGPIYMTFGNGAHEGPNRTPYFGNFNDYFFFNFKIVCLPSIDHTL
jgi:hypothetical protein